MAGVRRHGACGVAAFARTSLARGYAGLCERARCRYAMTSATSSLVLRQVLVNWSFRGAGSAGKCTQPAQAWLRVPASPESITTGQWLWIPALAAIAAQPGWPDTR